MWCMNNIQWRRGELCRLHDKSETHDSCANWCTIWDLYKEKQIPNSYLLAAPHAGFAVIKYMQSILRVVH
jgi:hypothetical protein